MADAEKVIRCKAPAKLNLTLDVLGRQADGYHEMKMVMQSVALSDELTLTTRPGEGITLRTDLKFLPTDRRNLAVAAALAFRERTGASLGELSIRIEKRLPVCAGMAGGSSDAAAVLRGLNDLLDTGLDLEELAAIGGTVGSDVPYCVKGGTALATGRGEVLEPLPPLPHCHIVIAKPPFPVSTPELFQRIDGRKLRCRPDTAGVLRALEAGDLQGVARRLYNVFEDVLPPQRRKQVEELKQALLRAGALGACMTGTGPAVFGLFEDGESAGAAWEEIRTNCTDTFLTESL